MSKQIYMFFVACIILLTSTVSAKKFEEAAETAPAATPAHNQRIILVSPLVEFLAMESNAPVEAPKADTNDLSEKIADRLVTQLQEQSQQVTRLDIEALKAAAPDVNPDDLFTLIRRARLEEPETSALQTYLSTAHPQGKVIIVRVRFYLEYWARSDRVFQVMDSVLLMADRSDKRMMVDARVHRTSDLGEVWRSLAQERVTPRASEKGINRAVSAIVDDYMQSAGKHGG